MQVIRNVARRSLVKNKRRNRIIILAVIITTMMFGVVFSLTSGILKSMEWQEMLEHETMAEGEIKYLTNEQYNILRKDDRIKDSSFWYRLALANNKELKKRNLEIRYADDKIAPWKFCGLKEGHMPSKKNEIVLDQIILRTLKIPCKLGSKVKIQFMKSGKQYEDTFILCGYYNGNKIKFTSRALVSKEYAKSFDWNKEDRLEMSVYLKKSKNIENQLESIVKDNLGKDMAKKISVSENNAYSTTAFEKMSNSDKALVVLVIMIIVFASYLIIHNVFMISIMKDIQFYGLLKTTGMTKQQIKKIIVKESNYFCLIGIPIGISMGIIIGNFLVPFILKNLGSDYPFSQTNGWWLFIVSALFSYVTVRLSCEKPGRVASKTSPIMALKATDLDSGYKRKAKHHHSTKFSYASMAMNNLGRNKAKTFLVIASMSLSFILFVVITSVIHSISFEQYAKKQISGEMVVSSNDLFKNASPIDITKKLVQHDEFMKNNGINIKGHVLYHGSMYYKVKDDAYQSYKKSRKNHQIHETDFVNDCLDEFEKDKKHELEMYLYGYDTYTAGNLQITEGEFNKEKYESGNYIILTEEEDYSSKKPKIRMDNLSRSLYHVGDKIKLGGKEYEVMAFAKVPYYNSLMMIVNMPQSWGILPTKEMLANDKIKYGKFGVPDPDTKIAKMIKVDPIPYSAVYELCGKDKTSWLKAEDTYTNKVDKELNYISESKIIGEMKKSEDIIIYLGGGFTIFISLIALLNFMNNIVTGILTRRKEFAMLRSVGMEKKQLLRMLVMESMTYITLSYLTACLIGGVASYQVVKVLAKKEEWYMVSPTLLPLLITLPVCIAIGIVIPWWYYHKESKLPVVELLSEE